MSLTRSFSSPSRYAPLSYVSSSPTLVKPKPTCVDLIPSTEFQFFVTLIPDDDPECTLFSGIHARSLLASRVIIFKAKLTQVLRDILEDVPRPCHTTTVSLPMYGEKTSTLQMLTRWLFRSQAQAPFKFDTDVWKYAKLADKYDIPLLRLEVEQYYLSCWPPGCEDIASQFVVFNEACRYHLDGIRDLYYRQVELNVVAFFTAGNHKITVYADHRVLCQVDGH